MASKRLSVEVIEAGENGLLFRTHDETILMSETKLAAMTALGQAKVSVGANASLNCKSGVGSIRWENFSKEHERQLQAVFSVPSKLINILNEIQADLLSKRKPAVSAVDIEDDVCEFAEDASDAFRPAPPKIRKLNTEIMIADLVVCPAVRLHNGKMANLFDCPPHVAKCNEVILAPVLEGYQGLRTGMTVFDVQEILGKVFVFEKWETTPTPPPPPKLKALSLPDLMSFCRTVCKDDGCLRFTYQDIAKYTAGKVLDYTPEDLLKVTMGAQECIFRNQNDVYVYLKLSDQMSP